MLHDEIYHTSGVCAHVTTSTYQAYTFNMLCATAAVAGVSTLGGIPGAPKNMITIVKLKLAVFGLHSETRR